MIQRLHRSDLGSSLRTLMENDPAFRPIAYFSMEVGLRESIPTYSGGLGVLAGDILKKDASLKANPSLAGVVINKRLFSRVHKVSRAEKAADKVKLQKIEDDFAKEVNTLLNIAVEKLVALTKGHPCVGVKGESLALQNVL